MAANIASSTSYKYLLQIENSSKKLLIFVIYFILYAINDNKIFLKKWYYVALKVNTRDKDIQL